MSAPHSAVAVAALALVFAMPAAAGGVYVGAGWFNGDAGVHTADGYDRSVSLRGLDLRLGWRFGQVLAVEARYGFGSGDDAALEHRRHRGLYLRSDWNLFARLDIYVFGGFTRVDGVLRRADGSHESVGNSAPSFGIGAEYTFVRRLTVAAEWWRMAAGGAYRPAVVDVGVNWQF